MTWMLTCATQADRDLVVATLRKESERREQAASRSALELVVGTADGRIGKARADAVRTFHEQAETLRVLAYELEQQPEVPLVTHDPVEEERAATYPPLRQLIAAEAEHAEQNRDDDIDYVRNAKPVDVVKTTPSGKTRKPRAVKLVEYNPDTDPALQAAMAAHPSNGTTPTQEDQT